ncbi:hypothetical protein GEMRC1_013476 [Eukaryota sp. GEM-RC1]
MKPEKKVPVCKKCGTEFTHGPGRPSPFCPECREAEKAEAPKRRSESKAEPRTKRTRGGVAAETSEIQEQLDDAVAARDKLRSELERKESENEQLQTEVSNWNTVMEKLKSAHPKAHEFAVKQFETIRSSKMEQ